MDTDFLKNHDVEFSMNNRCIRCSEQFQTQCSQLCIPLAYPTSQFLVCCFCVYNFG